MGSKCGLDIVRDDFLAIPQGRIELDFGKCGRIVLCRQDGVGFAGMRPQIGKRNPAHRHDAERPGNPRPIHPETQYIRFISASVQLVCRFSDTTAPTKEGLLWDDKIVSNLHEQLRNRGACAVVRNFGFPTLGINSSRQYGWAAFDTAAPC